MKAFIRNLVVATFVLTMVTFTWNICNAENAITLKFAHIMPEKSWVGQQHAKWAQELEKRSNGRLKIQIFWMGALVPYQNMLQGVQNNIADIGIYSSGYHTSQLPLLTAIETPGNYNGDSVAAVLASLDVQENQEDLKKELIRENVITVLPFTSGRGGIGAKKAFNSLEDLKGKTIRVHGGAFAKYYSILGMNPIFMSYSSVYEALERGTIDGFQLAILSSEGFKHQEITKFVLHDDTWTILATNVAMNRKVFNNLPQDLQKIIMDLKVEFGKAYAAQLTDKENEIIATWTAKDNVKFMKPSKKDEEAIVKACKEAREIYIKEQLKVDTDVAMKVWDHFSSALQKYTKK